MDKMPDFRIASEPLDLDDDLDEVPEIEDTEETNTSVTELSDKARLKMQVIQSLMSVSDRKTYGQRLQEGAAKLGKTVRILN